MNINVLFKDRGMVVVDKPAGLVSSTPEPDPDRIELWQIIQDRLNLPASNVAHRIDKNTSGVIIVGENPTVLKYFQRIWHQKIGKEYLAIIETPRWQNQRITSKLDGVTATTSFSILERQGIYSLVLCHMEQSGRYHQVRRHLRSINSPIIDDWRYGGRIVNARSGQLLHAWKISFPLPDDSFRPSREKTIQAKIPTDFTGKFDFEWSLYDIGACKPIATINV